MLRYTLGTGSSKTRDKGDNTQTSVADPDSLNSDPDTGFQVDPDPDPRFFDDQKLKKYSCKFFIYYFFINSCNIHIPRPP